MKVRRLCIDVNHAVDHAFVAETLAGPPCTALPGGIGLGQENEVFPDDLRPCIDTAGYQAPIPRRPDDFSVGAIGAGKDRCSHGEGLGVGETEGGGALVSVEKYIRRRKEGGKIAAIGGFAVARNRTGKVNPCPK